MAEEIRLNITGGSGGEKAAKSEFDAARERSDRIYESAREVELRTRSMSDTEMLLRGMTAEAASKFERRSDEGQFIGRAPIKPDDLIQRLSRSLPETAQESVQVYAPNELPQAPPLAPPPPPPIQPRRTVSVSPLQDAPQATTPYATAPTALYDAWQDALDDVLKPRSTTPPPPPQPPPAPPGAAPGGPGVPPAAPPPGGTAGPPNPWPPMGGGGGKGGKGGPLESPFPDWWKAPFQRKLWEMGGPQMQGITSTLGVTPWQATAGLAGVSALGGALLADIGSMPARLTENLAHILTAQPSASGVATAPISTAAGLADSPWVKGIGTLAGAGIGFAAGGPIGAVVGGAVAGGAFGAVSDSLSAFADTIRTADEALAQMTEDIRPFSAAASFATAMGDLLRLESRMRRADLLGSQLGDISYTRAEIETTLMDIQNNFLEPVLPLVEGGLIVLRDLLTALKPLTKPEHIGLMSKFAGENFMAAFGSMAPGFGFLIPQISKKLGLIAQQLKLLAQANTIPADYENSVRAFLGGNEFAGRPTSLPNPPKFRPLFGP